MELKYLLSTLLPTSPFSATYSCCCAYFKTKLGNVDYVVLKLHSFAASVHIQIHYLCWGVVHNLNLKAYSTSELVPQVHCLALEEIFPSKGVLHPE